MPDLEELQILRNMSRPGAKVPSVGDTLASLANAMAEAMEQVSLRLSELEKRAAVQKKALDHIERHAMVFMGVWQVESNYQPGQVVRHGNATFTALREILPGKAEPGQHGSGWDQLA
jgi:hypothetical protein